MAQFSYDVIPHRDGWGILVTPARLDAFPTRQAAFDTAIEFARKLRFVGFAINVRRQDEKDAAKARNRRAG
jgi:hypothetical protein